MGQPFKKKMLLSDDIYRALEPIDCFIHRSGFQARIGRTGDEILDLAHRDPPDVVMINYYLAGLKGDEVCRILKREQEGRPPVPILIIGPTHPPEIPDLCRQAGCDEYIGAPAGPSVLLQRLAAALGLQYRVHARIPAVLSISLGRVISEFLGYTKDISEGGMLVETTFPLDQGRRIYLRIFLDEAGRPLSTKATILRVDRSTEDEERYLLGMQFTPLEGSTAHRLRDFIKVKSEI